MTQTSNFTFTYNDLSGQAINSDLNIGDVVFVLGPNGSGKSRFMTKLASQNKGKTKRIIAHRQTWFSSNALDMTASGINDVENNILQRDQQPDSSWKDHFHSQRSQVTLFNLVNAENVLAREAFKALRTDVESAKIIARQETPLESLNSLLKLANIPIMISVEADEKIYASKNGQGSYSIAELSDGERNAILLISDVLTAKPGTLMVIDEPERHLHHSIVSPLLTSLFSKRPDCAFVIATHNIDLPQDNPNSSVLIIRSCAWTGSSIVGWDTDMLSAADEIDSQVKRSILGSRRKILFVEGTRGSLDTRIYCVLYPDVTVKSRGGCEGVKKAVSGISTTMSLNWIQAFGLIDADDRQQDELDSLKGKDVYALPCYSVESLYYCGKMIKNIAIRQASIFNGQDQNDLETKALDVVIRLMSPHKDRLCARVCERKVRGQIAHPTWKNVQSENDFKYEIDLKTIFNQEKLFFDSLCASKNIDGLLGRYPVRETEVLGEIAKALKFQTTGDYENAVIQLLIDNDTFCENIRVTLGELTTAIQS